MSKLYGTLVNDRNSVTTKCGYESIRACAQSFDGSVIVNMWYDKSDELDVSIEIANGSKTNGDEIFRGSIKELMEKLE